jgi:ribokinase
VDSPRILVAASINVDLVARADTEPAAGDLVHGTSFQMSLGGKGANVAVQVARSGGAPQIVASVGQDMLGDFALAELHARGVPTETILRAPTHTGIGHVWVDGDGEYRGIIVAGANAVPAMSAEDLAREAASCVAAVAQFESAQEILEGVLALTGAGCRVYLNPSPFDLELTMSCLDRCDVLVVNHSEAVRVAAAASGDALPATTARGPEELARLILERTMRIDEVVITLGAAGAIAHDRSGATHVAAAPAVEVVGTIGAGDAFLGEYVVSRSRGLGTQRSLERACAAGALATTLPGAQADAATESAIGALLPPPVARPH